MQNILQVAADTSFVASSPSTESWCFAINMAMLYFLRSQAVTSSDFPSYKRTNDVTDSLLSKQILVCISYGVT